MSWHGLVFRIMSVANENLSTRQVIGLPWRETARSICRWTPFWRMSHLNKVGIDPFSPPKSVEIRRCLLGPRTDAV